MNWQGKEVGISDEQTTRSTKIAHQIADLGFGKALEGASSDSGWPDERIGHGWQSPLSKRGVP